MVYGAQHIPKVRRLVDDGAAAGSGQRWLARLNVSTGRRRNSLPLVPVPSRRREELLVEVHAAQPHVAVRAADGGEDGRVRARAVVPERRRQVGGEFLLP